MQPRSNGSLNEANLDHQCAPKNVCPRKETLLVNAALPLTRLTDPHQRGKSGVTARLLFCYHLSIVVILAMDGRAATPPPVHHVLRPHHIDLIAMLLLIFKEFELQKTLPKEFLLYMYRVLLMDTSDVRLGDPLSTFVIINCLR